MMNKIERMEKLNKAGINTGKYFNINLPEGLKPGATISVVINENGQPVIVNGNDNDVVANQIIADGYVRNTKLHRRFVMAQMFHMLNYVSYDGYDKGYSACIRRMYSYDYALSMMLEEVRVLSKLEARDADTFEERAHFFTKEVIVRVLEDYVKKLMEYVDKLPNHKCKGVPYKRIKGVDIFNEDLFKKVYNPLVDDIRHIKYCTTYHEIYKHMCKFMKKAIKLPFDTPKSKDWIDAFKGNGAYYTMKNLIMYHDCVIMCGYNNSEVLTRNASMVELHSKLDEYQGDGWRMFAMMKKLIADNRINTKTYIAEICNK